MPYFAKGQCVYKKDGGAKVGCTKGPVSKYLAALHANVKKEGSVTEWESDSDDNIVGFDSYLDNDVFKLARDTSIWGIIVPKGTPLDQVNKFWKTKIGSFQPPAPSQSSQLKEIILQTIKEVLAERRLSK